MRRRLVRPNTRSYTGRHTGRPGADVVRFESGLEKDFLTKIRFRDDVLDVLEQPETFTYLDELGKKHRYTPDFRVQYVDRTVFYECKYRCQLRQNWELFRHIVSHMRQHLWERENAFFRIVTEATIRTTQLENIRLLTPFIHHDPDPDHVQTILNSLSTQEVTTVSELLSAYAVTNREKIYGALWSLIMRKKILIEWDHPIGMASKLRGPR